MILWRLFFVFSKIGLFNFGGGYAMLSFIQNEVVLKNGWLNDQEFTDIVAISQMTPGPIGINCATYVGYTAVMNDAAMQASCSPDMLVAMAMLGSIIASLSIIWLPFFVMLAVSKLIIKNKNSVVTKSIFGTLRPAVIGLLAAASLTLMTTANFGTLESPRYQFWFSIAIFLAAFLASFKFKVNPILTIIISALVGLLIYSPGIG